MKQVLSGSGVDTTSTVLAALLAGDKFFMADLMLIGEPDDPNAIWLTDWPSPLDWPLWGTFNSAVVPRSTVTTQRGLDSTNLTLDWSPPVTTFTASIATANPYQKAQVGFYDNWKVRIWTAYMPTAGDANTWGAAELFGGRVADTAVDRGKISFTVNSFLDVVNQYVPTNVIELLNTLAAYTGATPPPGDANVPIFNIVAPAQTNQLFLDEISPTAHHIYSKNALQQGYVYFLNPAGATLAGLWSAIQSNHSFTIAGTPYNLIQLYTPLPWPPTPGVDQVYISSASPINQADGDYFGFPYVPSPQNAVSG